MLVVGFADEQRQGGMHPGAQYAPVPVSLQLGMVAIEREAWIDIAGEACRRVR